MTVKQHFGKKYNNNHRRTTSLQVFPRKIFGQIKTCNTFRSRNQKLFEVLERVLKSFGDYVSSFLVYFFSFYQTKYVCYLFQEFYVSVVFLENEQLITTGIGNATFSP